ncbi:MAG: hypothetical protein AAB423_00475 [Patescibacteria group bacterium]
MFRKKKRETRNPHLGVSENQVYSYRSARKDNERQFDRDTQPKKESKFSQNPNSLRLKRVFRVVSALLILMFIIFLVSYVKSVGKLTISEGSNTAKQQGYKEVIDEQLKSNPINKNFWLIDQSTITEKLKDKYPEVQSVSYSYSIFDQVINIRVIISQPLLALSSNGNTYQVDSRGRVVEESYSGNTLITLIDGDNREYKKGDFALVTANLNYIHNIVEQSKARSFAIERMSIEHGATELYVKYLNDKYFVKYSLLNDPRLSFGTYVVAKEKAGQTPTEYIDVRVVDRAYIK